MIRNSFFKNRYVFLIIIIVLPIINSCKEKSNRGGFFQGKIINYTSDSIIYVPSFNHTHYDSINNKTEYHFLVLVNISCEACLSEIWDWKLFFDKNTEFNSLEVHFLLYGERYTLPSWIKNEPEMDNFYFWNDPSSFFIKKYELDQDLFLSAFLLNKKNKVIIVGNPIKSELVFEQIVEIISNSQLD